MKTRIVWESKEEGFVLITIRVGDLLLYMAVFGMIVSYQSQMQSFLMRWG